MTEAIKNQGICDEISKQGGAMDTEKCRILLRVIAAGSLSAAAETLGYTPSGVTRAVNALEREFGFPVLTRSSQGIDVTPNGQRMLPIIREFVRRGDSVRELGLQIQGLEVGELMIGAYYSVAANWLPDIIRSFQAIYPQIRIHILEGDNKQLYGLLNEQKVDCCIISRREYQGEWIFLQYDELVVWLPEDHRLAQGKVYPLAALTEEKFIEPLPGGDTDVAHVLQREGVTRNIQFTALDNYTTYRMVEAGLGVSINNRLMTASWKGKVKILPMDPPRYIELGIAIPSLAEASPAMKRFVDYIRKWVQDRQPVTNTCGN